MESNTKVAVTPPPVTGNGAKQARITTSFLVRNSHAQLAVSVDSIIAALTGNGAFPTPSPTLATITAAYQDYVAKRSAAAGGGRLATAQFADSRTALIRLMRELALDLQKDSGGDRTKLVSTGFPLRRDNLTAVALAAPRGLRVQRGAISGQLIVRCGASRQAKVYLWRYATAQAPATWIQMPTTTRAQTVIAGLAPGTQYLVQASLRSPAGESDWSDSVAAYAN